VHDYVQGPLLNGQDQGSVGRSVGRLVDRLILDRLMGHSTVHQQGSMLTKSSILLALGGAVMAYDNGLASSPPMGWNTWCTDDLCGLIDHCTEKEVKSVADAMVSSGLADLGYTYVSLPTHVGLLGGETACSTKKRYRFPTDLSSRQPPHLAPLS
jgi:ABC-type molybdate transport system substrate-binding protein